MKRVPANPGKGTLRPSRNGLSVSFPLPPLRGGQVLGSGDMTVADFRRAVFGKLVARGMLDAGADPHQVRLREKTSYRGGKVLRNCRGTLRAAMGSLYDGKEIAVQLLDEPEDLEYGLSTPPPSPSLSPSLSISSSFSSPPFAPYHSGVPQYQ